MFLSELLKHVLLCVSVKIIFLHEKSSVRRVYMILIPLFFVFSLLKILLTLGRSFGYTSIRDEPKNFAEIKKEEKKKETKNLENSKILDYAKGVSLAKSEKNQV